MNIVSNYIPLLLLDTSLFFVRKKYKIVSIELFGDCLNLRSQVNKLDRRRR